MTNKNHIRAVTPAASDLPDPTTAFQPVVDTRGWHVPGHALYVETWTGDGRLIEGVPADPPELASLLRRTLLDVRRRELAGDLFLPLPPAVMRRGEACLQPLLDACAASAIDPERLVLCGDGDALAGTLAQQARLLGLRLALDFPADATRLRTLRPAFLRLPPWLGRDLTRDMRRRRRVEEALTLAGSLDARVLATGVGDGRCFEAYGELGVGLMQGDWLAPASAWPAHSVPPRVPVLEGPARLASTPVSADRLAGLVCDHFFVRPEATVAELRRHAAGPEGGRVLPVVEAGRVLGVVDSRDLFTSDKACASDLMRPARLLLPAEGDARRLGELIQQGAMAPLEDDLLLVDRRGAYAGRVRLEDLFHALAGLTWQAWRYADPLTRLPGQVPVDEHVRALMQQGRLFVVACIDIDGFQPYNDHYGYERGDEVLLAMADLFRRHLDTGQDFLAHIGGDNFAIVFQSSDWFERCEAIERDCDALVPAFYSEAHRAAGGIDSHDRLGRPVFHPLLALSMGIVQVEPGKFPSHRDVMRAAREVKRRAQATHGSTMFIDERGYGLAAGCPPALCN